jgi:hypothetical protein
MRLLIRTTDGDMRNLKPLEPSVEATVALARRRLIGHAIILKFHVLPAKLRKLSAPHWRSTQWRPPALFQSVISASFFGSRWVCMLIADLHSLWHHLVLPITHHRE